MSTHPAYDPDPQADPPDTAEPGTDREQLRVLVNHLVRAAAPKLGKTAVARIARPLTEALIGFRAATLDNIVGWRLIGERLGAADPSDPVLAMAALSRITTTGLPSVAQVEAQVERAWPGYDAAHDNARGIANAAIQLVREAQQQAAKPIEVGEVITTAERLAHAPVGTVLRDAEGVLFERFRDPADQPGRWYSTGVVNAVDFTLPVRVLDLGGSA